MIVTLYGHVLFNTPRLPYYYLSNPTSTMITLLGKKVYVALFFIGCIKRDVCRSLSSVPLCIIDRNHVIEVLPGQLLFYLMTSMDCLK